MSSKRTLWASCFSPIAILLCIASVTCVPDTGPAPRILLRQHDAEPTYPLVTETQAWWAETDASRKRHTVISANIITGEVDTLLDNVGQIYFSQRPVPNRDTTYATLRGPSGIYLLDLRRDTVYQLPGESAVFTAPRMVHTTSARHDIIELRSYRAGGDGITLLQTKQFASGYSRVELARLHRLPMQPHSPSSFVLAFVGSQPISDASTMAAEMKPSANAGTPELWRLEFNDADGYVVVAKCGLGPPNLLRASVVQPLVPGQGGTLLAVLDRELLAIKLDSFAVAWRSELPREMLTGSLNALSDTTVVWMAEDGRAYVVHSRAGAIMGDFEASRVPSYPIVTTDSMYYIGSDLKLHVCALPPSLAACHIRPGSPPDLFRSLGSVPGGKALLAFGRDSLYVLTLP